MTQLDSVGHFDPPGIQVNRFQMRLRMRNHWTAERHVRLVGDNPYANKAAQRAVVATKDDYAMHFPSVQDAARHAEVCYRFMTAVLSGRRRPSDRLRGWTYTYAKPPAAKGAAA